MNKIKIENLSKSYKNREIFRNFDFEFPAKGIVTIIGKSGQGKSTLLEIISGLTSFEKGKITLFDKDLSTMTKEELGEFRLLNIGFIRQRYDLLELENVIDNVLWPTKKIEGKKINLKQRALDLLTLFKLEDKAKQNVNLLSGGEQQRVAWARALILDPPILLLDEPTGALDQENVALLIDTLNSLSEKKLIILVTHDRNMAVRCPGKVYELKNGQLILKRENPKTPSKHLKVNHLVKLSPKKARIKDFLFHAFHIFRAKKWRSTLAVTLLTLASSFLCLSLFIEQDLEGSLTSSLSSLTGKNEIVVTKEGSGSPIISSVGVDEDLIKTVNEALPKVTDGYGATYLADFENYFPEENNGYILLNGNRRLLIPNLTVRTFNDYQWLEDYKEQTFYPARPEVLEMDQIVLGVPNDLMINICYNLQILRTFDDLGFYLSQKPVPLLLKMQNDYWTYEDEQLFSIRAVTYSPVVTIYHTSRLWNEWVIETKMRFPTSIEDDDTYPWIMKKTYYLHLISSFDEFFKEARKLNRYEDFIFDRASFSYLSSLTIDNELLDIPRVYVYLADKDIIPKDLGNEILKEIEGLKGVTRLISGVYISYPSSFMEGFIHPLILAKDEASLEEVKITFDYVRGIEDIVGLSLPDKCKMGSYIFPRDSNLIYRDYLNENVEGKPPISPDEICISKPLADYFLNTDVLYTMVMKMSTMNDGRLIFSPMKSKVKVTGVIDEPGYIIYGRKDWQVDYFRDYFGFSSFDLESRQFVFKHQEKIDTKALQNKLLNHFPDCTIVSPQKIIQESVTSIMLLLKTIVYVLTFFAVILSIFLLFSTSHFAVTELKNEGKTLFNLGFSFKEIFSMYFAFSLLLMGISSVFSFLMAIFLQNTLQNEIGALFGGQSSFTIDPISILTVLIFFLVGLAFSYLSITLWLKKRSFENEERT